jgi:hypothetical protein
VTTLSFVGLAGLCATAAAFVPVGTTTTQAAQDKSQSQGMVCEWGDGTSGFTATRSFTLTATSGYTTEPDGNAIFDWSYSADGSFQLPGPTLCANTGENVVVTLQNNLPVRTSIQFPGQSNVTYSSPTATPSAGAVGPVADSSGNLFSLVQTAEPGNHVIYSFPANHEGTYLYQSGTDPQLQVQMGLFGGLVIYPSGVVISDGDIDAIPYDGSPGGVARTNGDVGAHGTNVVSPGVTVRDEATCAYRSADPTTPTKCDPLAIYEADRENILILSEVDPGLHSYMEQQQLAGTVENLNWNAYPVGYAAHYFMINGRSMPDTIAPNFAPWLPTQPYGSLATVEPWTPSNPLDAFIRYIGVGNAGYDFHPHSNHEHVIAADGNLMKGQPVIDDTGAIVTPGTDFTEEKYNLLVGTGSTLDATFRWTNEEGYADGNGSRVPVQWPQAANLLEGDFWSGSPYLGDQGVLNPGIVGKGQCGEYYHVAHDHNLTHVTNYGITFGGMLTLIKVEPAGSSTDIHSACYEG